MSKISSFSAAVDAYRQAIRTARVQPEKDPSSPGPQALMLSDAWLMQLYSEHHLRLLHDNNRIWNGGQLLIPAALVPFGALASFQSPPTHATLSIFALVSLALVLFWHIMAEGHKAFQQKSVAWMTAIEEELGLPSRKLPTRVYSDGKRRSFVVREDDMLPIVRQVIVFLFALGWLGLMILYPTR